MELRDLIEMADNGASKIFDRTGRVLPMYHSIKRDGEHCIFSAPDGDKDTSVYLARAVFELLGVVSYVYINEAWVLERLGVGADIGPSEMRRINREGLSEHPDRIEVLAFLAEDATGRLSAHRQILRPEHGKPKLMPLKFVEVGKAEGRMVNLLPGATR